MNPFQIGVITIGASPVALSTLAAGNPALLKKLTIFNTGSGVVYLGSSTMNITTMAGVVAVIPAGANFPIGSDHMIDKVDWQKYSIHGSHATDLVVVTGETVS
jgi:hypothetical protein